MDTGSFELTIEQQFQMSLMERSAQEMSREQMLDLFVQVLRQTMIKDNVIRDLLKNGVWPA